MNISLSKFKRVQISQYSTKHYARSMIGNIIVIIFLLCVAGFLAMPLVYAIANSLKPFSEIFVYPPRFFVVNPTLDNFRDLFVTCANQWIPFSRYFFNSCFISVTTTVLTVFISSLCAYPLAKNDFPFKEKIFSTIVVSLLFVSAVTFLPQYLVISKLGMIDTYWALIIPPLSGSLGVFLMKQFMEQIPTAIIEAARIDGCGEFKIFRLIIMPNVKPAWMTLIIFTFQGIWNNSSIQQFVFNEELRTLPSLMQQIVSGNTMAYAGVGAASAVFMMIPSLIIFIATQGSVMQTMAFAGIKE